MLPERVRRICAKQSNITQIITCRSHSSLIQMLVMASSPPPSPSTYPPPNASDAECSGLAQRFVDELCARCRLFKPCVSFGQDNGLVYCTVPATSTQGAIKAEDKAKQLVGGVQLVRLSFPPTLDMISAKRAFSDVVVELYKAC
mmetsp:Transcript_32972/g.39918  ORF Transcript_32972/g.39918 Transcript_32972/m.39918 type:complete len:144 (-) Transcript_32972:95-526(-)